MENKKNNIMTSIFIGVIIGFFCGKVYYHSNNPVVQKCINAVKEKELISNDTMAIMYPHTYHKASPQYLEIDFEAGADFICDTIQYHYKTDICSTKEIHWR